MDQMPQPVDLGALTGLLARSREVMNKLDDSKPMKGKGGRVNESYDNSYTEENYNETDEREPVYEQHKQHNGEIPHEVLGPIDYDENIVRNSRLPENIKQLMISHPIKQTTMQSGAPQFTAEQIARIKGQPLMESKPQSQGFKQVVNENHKGIYNSDMITVSKSQLKEMINEGISTFFKQVYDKTLTEETIKKTINVLIKEGKIGVKK